ncbi:3-deoxy-7-phosphoheptulonate synthase [Alkalibacter rhizosphaerae]|uniref:3-deoxy-7-phosphoheptulonate synthase n=1 Tax=Alkalibacter rhizosphaerae TaxID=2815577 RepID=A0A975AH82_9FIRM|nr:3-deoxy-7-phosphoheptulonate synthase [Alkalibacter rhizosphaerae]QSX07733.1 3-deoxy-7-phosphoheptulonate synthase [Alkalibacter rhizosphaerae]
MIIVVKSTAPRQEVEKLKDMLQKRGMEINYSEGVDHIVMGLIGDTRSIDVDSLASIEIVEKVLRVQEPYKKANRSFHPEDSRFDIGGGLIGGGAFAVMAGPCSVESEEQVLEVAKRVKKSGATFLRGGAFKPRTSPYSFQGMGLDGLELLLLAKAETGLPIVSEIMSTEYLDEFVEKVDIIQVGARNMQNFAMLTELGKCNKPILLKRGMCATIEEWLMSAEYIMKEGNEEVILCERGIRTFETFTRNTLDLSAIPAIKKKSHLPIVVDPSHSTGMWWMVESMAKAAVAAGADGLMIEVHNAPEAALCDGAQSLKPDKFDQLMDTLEKYTQLEGKVLR